MKNAELLPDQIAVIRRGLSIERIDRFGADLRLDRWWNWRTAWTEAYPVMLGPLVTAAMFNGVAWFSSDAKGREWITSRWNLPWVLALVLVMLGHLWLSSRKRTLSVQPGFSQAVVKQGASAIRLPITGLWMDDIRHGRTNTTVQLDGVPFPLRRRWVTRRRKVAEATDLLRQLLLSKAAEDGVGSATGHGVSLPLGVRASLVQRLTVEALEPDYLRLRSPFAAGIALPWRDKVGYVASSVLCTVGSALIDCAAQVNGAWSWWPRPVILAIAAFSLWRVRKAHPVDITIVPGRHVLVERAGRQHRYACGDCVVAVENENATGEDSREIFLGLRTPDDSFVLGVGAYGDPLSWFADRLNNYLQGGYGVPATSSLSSEQLDSAVVTWPSGER
jgi:hypothetical protein